MPGVKHYLVVYDRSQGRLVSITRFGSERRAEALRARFEREEAERANPNIEVNLLGAPSRKALERTHARYFKSASRILSAATS